MAIYIDARPATMRPASQDGRPRFSSDTVWEIAMVAGDGAVPCAAAVTDRRISTVVPAEVTGDNRVHELANIDLAMKLHYLRVVHYFPAGGAAAGLTVPELKYPMFHLLETYYPACGRVRRSDPGGRPVVKCNDSGARVMEARCGVSLGDWLAAGEHGSVAPDKVLGPEVKFSPPVVVQFTRFKCGALAVGFSWCHMLGDAVSATNFMRSYGQILGGNPPAKPLHHPRSSPSRPEKSPESHGGAVEAPSSARQVNTPSDTWLPVTGLKMGSFSFRLSGAQVGLLRTKASARAPFEAISAVVWRSLARFRGARGRELKTVTVCKANASAARSSIMSNEQAIGAVRADDLICPRQAALSDLAALIAGGFADETEAVAAMVENRTGGPDLVVYGANLTFVDLEDVDAYGMELKGQAPSFVNYSVEGVGDEGAVLVFRGPKAAGEEDGAAAGRTVNVILEEDEILRLRKEMEDEWGIA